jgi:hypothetical protein
MPQTSSTLHLQVVLQRAKTSFGPTAPKMTHPFLKLWHVPDRVKHSTQQRGIALDNPKSHTLARRSAVRSCLAVQ